MADLSRDGSCLLAGQVVAQGGGGLACCHRNLLRSVNTLVSRSLYTGSSVLLPVLGLLAVELHTLSAVCIGHSHTFLSAVNCGQVYAL